MDARFSYAVFFSIGFLLSAIVFFSVFDYRLKTTRSYFEECASEWESSFSRIDSINARADTITATLMQNDQFLWNKIQAVADSTNVTIR